MKNQYLFEFNVLLYNLALLHKWLFIGLVIYIIVLIMQFDEFVPDARYSYWYDCVHNLLLNQNLRLIIIFLARTCACVSFFKFKVL